MSITILAEKSGRIVDEEIFYWLRDMYEISFMDTLYYADENGDEHYPTATIVHVSTRLTDFRAIALEDPGFDMPVGMLELLQQAQDEGYVWLIIQADGPVL